MDINTQNIKLDSVSDMSVAEVKDFFNKNSCKIISESFEHYKKLVNEDKRAGVVSAFNKIEKAKKQHEDEVKRVKKLYDFQKQIAVKPGNCVIVGLDEVGRGPLAGPLTVGAVVLDQDSLILGLNDSKKINEDKRKQIAEEIKKKAIAWKTFSVPPKYIDTLGMTECLRRAFANAVKQIENDGVAVDIVLLDGNPLSFDSREVNVIKGDAKCASISAASIVAKVERDSYMEKISVKYPQYNFAKNKGYGTAEHIDAIKSFGLSPVHRKSFCTSFMQMSLF